jgi:outer membrane autotransporter protein
MGNFRFMPMLYLQYNRLEINEYSEHGAGEFNMRVRTDDLDSLISFLGARANYTFIASQNVTIRPEMTIGWQREYLSDSISSSFNTIELATPQGVCSTIAPERNTLIVGADIYVKMFQQTSLELNYQFTYNNILRDHEFYLQWKFEF